jgi:thiopurine S-methyltransferase
MEHKFWHERWEQNQIGFHQPEANGHLRAFWPRFEFQKNALTFVPLCGKSLDMLWLRSQDMRVLGVELSEIAVSAFFTENGLRPETSQKGPFKIFKADGVEILCGDFFQLTAEHLSAVSSVYDRASLVALPPDMRGRYAEKLTEALPADVTMALLTFEYEQSAMAGPPFSVSEEEVASLYAGKFKLEKLHETVVPDAEMDPFKKRGLALLREKVYKLKS